MSLRIGIVGAGSNARSRHIPGLRAIPGVEIASVCNRSHESAERVAREFSIPRVYERWQDMVAADDTQAVVIGTWPYLHAPVTLAALARGKHVLTEARMAMDAAEAHRMLHAARLNPGLITQVVPAPFTLRVDRTAKRLIADGFVGDVLVLEARVCSGFADRDSPLHWRQDRDFSGLNMMSLGIWYEQAMRWVGHATRVMASGKVFVARRKEIDGTPRDVLIPDHVDALADLPGGARMHIQVSAVSGMAGPAEMWVFGNDGTLRFSENRLFGGRRGDRELREIMVPPAEEGAWRVEEEFVGAIRGQEEVRLTTFADGVRYMEFTEAVAQSIETGTAVSLPLTRTWQAN